MGKYILFLAALLLAAPTQAADIQHAHPALWHVTGPEGDVYLLGAIHALPPTIDWRTPAINKAIERADVLVFEAPEDSAGLARVQALIAEHGALPAGQSLRALLMPAAQTQFDDLLTTYHLPLARIDHDRPWLASLLFLALETQKQGMAATSGVDRVLMDEAAAKNIPTRYFETIDQQFALLAPDDDTLALQEFESGLKDFHQDAAELAALIDAWSKGDVQHLDHLMNSDLADYPDAKKALFTDRNQRWVLQIETMLTEKRRFFITVGAGHLTGADGVPTLLRKAGYKVEGP